MIDYQYIELANKIIKDGKIRKNRTGVDAITIPHSYIEYDMKDGFPLINIRKLGIRSISAELEGFLRGATDKKWYQKRKCTIWDEWSNPLANNNDDLGTFYAWQWRNFNGDYSSFSNIGLNPDISDIQDDIYYNESGDQLKNILKTIKVNNNDRRMLCSAWNPLQIKTAALPSCHTEWKVNTLCNKVNLSFKMRSWDYVLGAPYNIASYAILLLLLCKYTGYEPGKLSVFADDVHIYINHIEKFKEIIQRVPFQSPDYDISINNPFEFKENKLLINWTYKDIILFDYQSHDKVDFDVAI